MVWGYHTVPGMGMGMGLVWGRKNGLVWVSMGSKKHIFAMGELQFQVTILALLHDYDSG